MARKAHQNSTRDCFACGRTDVPTNGHGLFAQHPCAARGTPVDNATMRTHGWAQCPDHGADYAVVWVTGPYSAYPQCNHPRCDANAKHGGKPGPWRYQGKPRASAPQGGTSEASDTNAPPEQTATTEQTVTPQSKPAPQAPINATGIDLKMLGSLGETIQAYVDARATEIATELVAQIERKEAKPVAVEWRINGQPFVQIEGTHHRALPRVLKLYAAGFRNFLVVGPAGSGKTTLAHNLADALKLRFAAVACTSGMSESTLTGRAIPNLATGETTFQSTEFVALYETGGVFLLDEVDAADANVMLVTNGALANGALPLPNRVSAPSAKRHADSVVICAANTYGNGADRQYVGRNQSDAAFLDRFVGATVEVDYDRDLESSLVGDANICARVWEVRSKVLDCKLRRFVGTRFLMSVARLVKGAGEGIDAALMACTVGWTSDERSKAGVRVE